MDSISVIIHTYNAQGHILECIQSAQKLTNDILVIDMESTDKTKEYVTKQRIKLLNFPLTHYVEPARSFGIEQAQTEWVFILDADERLTPELVNEIKKILKNQGNSTHYTLDPKPYVSYRVPRKNIFGKKKWLQHGGWWPDYQIRLINKNFFKNWPKEIHSTPQIEGNESFLTNPLLHYFHGDLENMVYKTTIFENIESDMLFKANRQVSTPTFFRKFAGELYRRLLKHRGFLDGNIGIIEAIYQAFSKTITYLYLYEKKKSRTV